MSGILLVPVRYEGEETKVAADPIPSKYVSATAKTKKELTRIKMAVIETTLARFYIDCGRYPNESKGLEALITPPTEIEEDKWKGPYLEKKGLLDLWGNPYIYIAEGQYNPGSFDLISYGQDAMEGGGGRRRYGYRQSLITEFYNRTRRK